jgi:hypothetical protein
VNMCHGVGDILKPQGDTSSYVGDVTSFTRAATSGRPQGPPLPCPSVASEAYRPRFKQKIRPVMPLDGLGGVGRGNPSSPPGQVVAPDGIVMQVWVRPVKPAGIVGTRLAAFAPAR